MFRLLLLSLFFFTAHGASCIGDTASGTGIYEYGTWDSSTNTFTVTSNIPDFAYGASPFFNCEIEGESEFSIVFSNDVTSIGNLALRSKSSEPNLALTSITIGNSVESIGDYAFAYCGLTSLDIPDSVTSIGNSGFRSNALTSVTIGNSLTSIAPNLFAYNALTSITVPDSVTSIGDYAFTPNPMTSITIGNGVTSISSYAFHNVPLTEITASATFYLNFVTGVNNQNAIVNVDGVSIDCSELTSASCSELKSTYNAAECCV